MGRKKPRWDKTSFLDKLRDKKGPEAAELGQRLHDWAVSRGITVAWGDGPRWGSMHLCYGPARTRLVSLYTIARVDINFGWMEDPPFDDAECRGMLLNSFCSIKGVPNLKKKVKREADGRITGYRTFRLEVLADSEAFDQFLTVLENVLKLVADESEV